MSFGHGGNDSGTSPEWRLFARTNRSGSLSSSVILLGWLLAGLIAGTSPATAACSVTPAGAVTCNANTTTTNSTNTDGGNPSSVDETQLWNNGTNITAVTTGSITVNGYGLVLEETGVTQASIGMVNNSGSTIQNSSLDGDPALTMTGNGGSISYSGSGSIVDATGPGISVTNTGVGQIHITTAGTISVGNDSANQDGIDTNAADGTTTIDLTNGKIQGDLLAGSDGLEGSIGINSTSLTGSITITANNIAKNDFALTGINASITGSGAGAISITTLGTINASADAVDASNNSTGGVTLVAGVASALSSTNGDGQYVRVTGTGGGILITNAVGSSIQAGSDGIDAQITNSFDSGNVIVHANGAVTGNSTGIIAATNGTGNIQVDGAGAIIGGSGAANGPQIYGSPAISANVGIFANQDGTLGGITVGGTGTTSGNDAILAVIDNSANSSNILVNRSGAVTVTGTAGWGIAAETFGAGSVTVQNTGTIAAGVSSTIFTGILAESGGGSVFVSNVGAITANATTLFSYGIYAATSGTGTVTVNGTSTVNSTGDAVDAITTGTGDVSVTNTGAIVADSGVTGTGNGILATSNGGGIIVTPGSTVSGAVGISAGTTGNGNVLVTANSAVTGHQGDAIFASATDGTINVTANAAVKSTAGGDGVDALTNGLGAITVAGSGTVTGAVSGIVASESGAGPGAGNTGILIEGGGNTAATSGAGISATITNALNAADIIINRSGTVTVAAGGGDGIEGITAGIGNVTVTNVGNVTAGTGAGAIGIEAKSHGGNIQVTPAGFVSGGNGIDAETLLTGSVTVTTPLGATGNVTGLAGYGVNTSAQNGNTIITNNAVQISGTTWASDSASTGTGTITVTGAGNYIGGTLGGIGALATGLGPGAGNNAIVITGTGNTSATTGIGISAVINNAGNASNILINRSGTVTVAAGGGDGIDGITAGIGNVTVTNVANVVAGTGPSAIGIDAVSHGGIILVTPAGSVIGGNGINASTTGAGTVTVTTPAGAPGNVTGLAGYGVNTSAQNGNTIITNNAAQISGTTWASDSASTGTGTITVTGAGNYVGGTLGGIGALASGAGPGAGNTEILITGAGNTSATTGIGISAVINNAADAGDILVNRTGTVTVAAGGGDGIDGITAGIGNVTVTGVNNVQAGTGSGAIGIDAVSHGGAILVTPAGFVSGGNGINGSTTGAGTVTITTASGAGGNVTGVAGYGVSSSAQNGNTIITNNAAQISGTTWASHSASTGTGTITVTGAGNYAGGTLGGIGALASGAGPGAGNNAIAITGTGNTSATTGVGISAVINNPANAGNILINRSGTVLVGAGGLDGIDAVTSGIGNVTITNIGTVLAGTGTSTVGIDAASQGGNILVTPVGTVTGGGVGIEAGTILAGTVTVTTITDVTGSSSNGIQTSAANGVTAITVNGGTVTGNGSGNAGVSASASGTGSLGVTIASGAIVTGGLTAGGVRLSQTGTGSNNIDNAGTILGVGTAVNPVIAIATTSSGSTLITIDATGLVESTNATANNKPADLAVLSTVTTGNNTIANSGTLIGEVSLSNATNLVHNLTGGIWDVRDNAGAGFIAASFGTGGANTLNNAGTINAGNAIAAATSTFTGVQTIINSGTINAGLFSTLDVTTFDASPPALGAQSVTNTGTINVHGLLAFKGDATFNNAGGIVDLRTAGHATTDVMTLNTTVGAGALSNTYVPGSAYDFAGGSGSRLGVDTFVGQFSSVGASVPSDRLLISGAATLSTGILVNDTDIASGSFNPVGITLVAVNGSSTDAFTLQGLTSSSGVLQAARGPMGAIKKGFWFYPLLQSTHAEAAADGLSGPNSTEYRLYGLPDAEAYEMPLAITGAQNVWYETVIGWSDRMRDARRSWNDSRGAAGDDNEPGVWLKVTGSWSDRTDSASPSTLIPPIPAASVLAPIDTSFNQHTYSVQLGADISPRHVLASHDVVVLGASVGYISSSLDFKATPNSFDYSGPTVSAYANYIDGAFFLDALVKADFLNLGLQLNSLAPFGYSSQSKSADTWGAMSDLGFHFSLNSDPHSQRMRDWYLEPLVTIAYTDTQLDSFTALGTTTSFTGGDTFRGALGAGLGGPILNTGEQTTVDFSVTGKYWDEFTNDTHVVLTSLGPALALTDRRARGFGEVIGAIDFTNFSDGWSGFVDGGAQFNSEFTTTELKGGVRYSW